MQPRSWRRAWKTGGFIRRLSGLTLEPSTRSRGVASFIASLRETPASPTASPAAGREPPTTAGSSTRCSESSIACGLIVSSARTSRGTRTDRSRPSSQHWKAWATALRQEYSARPRSAPATAGSGCYSWPTATAIDGRRGVETDDARKARGAKTGTTLNDAVGTWPTPTTSDTNGERRPDGKRNVGLNTRAGSWPTPVATPYGSSQNGICKGKPSGNTPSLERQAKAWPTPTMMDSEQAGGQGCIANGKRGHSLHSQATQQWPTPMARDHRSGHAVKSDEELWGKKGRPLERVATAFHCSPQDPPIPSGTKSSSERRTLNPLFVEWLMGLPRNWTLAEPLSTSRSPRPSSTSPTPCAGASTGSAPAETPWCPWLRRMRGELSRLLCGLNEQRSSGRLL